MNVHRMTIIPLLLGLLAGCSAMKSSDGPIDAEGLAQREHGTLDRLLVRPTTDFASYRKVKIEPITVSFSKDRRYDSLHRGKDAFTFNEREQARFNQQFVNALSMQWNKAFGWELTDEPGDDVIVVKTQVTDLYLYASIKNNTIYPSKTFAYETSKMVISMQMLDSDSGEVLLRSSGKKRTGENKAGAGSLTRVSSVSYWNDAYQAFRQWAAVIGTQIN